MSGKVLITGGFGNLGSWVVKYLSSLDYDITILTRKETKKISDAKYDVIECDITDYVSLEKSLDYDVDYCIHLASLNEFFLEDYPAKALSVNTLGTRNLLEVLSKKDLKNFIYFSTFHVYGVNSGVIDEQTSISPKNDYAATHLFAEFYVKQFFNTHNINYTILRLTNSYGAPTFVDTDKWYLILNDLVSSAYNQKKIIIKSNGEIQRDFIHMNDVASVLDKIIKNNVYNETFNLSSANSIKLKELAYLIQEVYKDRYNIDIEISLNHNDTNIYKDLCVENNKLKSYIDFEVKNCFKEEINKIFELLEKR